MSLLPAVILAQVVNAGIGDRVEVRQVVDVGTRQLEAENSAYGTVGLTYPWLRTQLTYSPSLTLAPLEETPRDLVLNNRIDGYADSLTTLYQASRFMTTLHIVATYLQQDYGRSLVGSPLPAGARPIDPQTPPDASSAETVRASGITTRLATLDTDLGFTEAVSRRSTFGQSVGYAASVGVDAPSRQLYPFTHGPTASLSHTYVFDPRNTLTSLLEGSMAYAPSTGNRAYRVDYEERLVHLFSRQTYSEFQIGVAYTRAELDGEPPISDVTPTAEAAITTNKKAAGGDLSLGMRLTYGPELDRTALVFDTRIGVEGNIGWTKGPFSSYAGTATAVSVNPDDAGSLSGVSGNMGVRYELGAGFMTEGGLRFAWQEYEGEETLPATWVAFIALSWGMELL
jgi:hypothetical protein